MGDTPSIDIIKALFNKDANIYVHDPIALDVAKGLLGNQIQYLNSIEECIKLGDIVVFTDLDPEYLKLDSSVFTQDSKKRVIVDIWRNFKYLEDFDGIYYIPIGKNVNRIL